ncbi:serine/threonine-protein kinase [Actinacidiphila glaucinigra]|uniref:non-specific serine/threonine protein kinase n=1 Tax=Actinacidiphila glaucinigra TaxID=235986 RepID=A0A239NUQ1_9ACTN|nr:serine/threonine-protein kinase [Actinacidiphila glaucinigra]SNT58597.1 Serine/threonine protein kinase [Actinacidiphila glaucinigra]
MRVLSGRYELVETVGRGGMGEVWRGVDRELGRAVAVKVLPPELTRHEEFRSRFRREARTVASLTHRGIAVLHDVGEDTGEDEAVPYLVMEFIDGRTLAEVLGDGPLTMERSTAIMRDVADALAHSHAQGLVHRDVKPSNVMITADGQVKILDFGIAKVVADTATRLTATGMTVGTPAYLSPEQIHGTAVDARTDQYSLGCLFYELLTGRPPFTGDSPFAVMNQHLAKDPVPPSALRPQLPADVDAVVLRALAKQPDQRFLGMGALRDALGSLHSGGSLAGTAGGTRLAGAQDQAAVPGGAPGRAQAAAAAPPLPPQPVSAPTVPPVTGAFGAPPPVATPAPGRVTFGALWRGERLAPFVATLLSLPVVISAWDSYEYAGSTTTVALVASWLTALVLTFLRPGLAGAFAAVAPATLLSVRDDMPGTVVLALLVVACAAGVFYRSGLAAQALSYGAILCAGPVIANTTGYYGEGATFLLLAAAACTALAVVRHPRRHGEG